MKASLLLDEEKLGLTGESLVLIEFMFDEEEELELDLLLSSLDSTKPAVGEETLVEDVPELTDLF